MTQSSITPVQVWGCGVFRIFTLLCFGWLLLGGLSSSALASEKTRSDASACEWPLTITHWRSASSYNWIQEQLPVGKTWDMLYASDSPLFGQFRPSARKNLMLYTYPHFIRLHERDSQKLPNGSYLFSEEEVREANMEERKLLELSWLDSKPHEVGYYDAYLRSSSSIPTTAPVHGTEVTCFGGTQAMIGELERMRALLHATHPGDDVIEFGIIHTHPVASFAEVWKEDEKVFSKIVFMARLSDGDHRVARELSRHFSGITIRITAVTAEGLTFTARYLDGKRTDSKASDWD